MTDNKITEVPATTPDSALTIIKSIRDGSFCF